MPLTEDQKAARLKGLGGSDMGAIAGVDKYRGRLAVWSRFHLPDETEEEDSEQAYWGNALEDPIAERYARDEGVQVERVNRTIKHPEHRFLLANPDRLIVGKEHGLEIKTAGLRVADEWGDPDSDIMPDSYRLQCVEYMAVTGFSRWDVAVLIGGQDFRIYRLHRDRELENLVIESAREFWEKYIVTGVQPPVEGVDAGQFIKRLYPRDLLPEGTATQEMIAAATRYAEAKALAKEYEIAADEARNRLCAFIGETAGFRWGTKNKATWTNNKDGVKVDYEGVVKELNVPEELIQKYTRITTGPRVLRVAIKE